GGSSWSRWPGCRASGFSSVRAPRRGECCRPDVTPAHPGGEAAYEMDLQLGRVHSASFGSLRLLSNQCARPLEDLVEHRPGEPTGEGVCWLGWYEPRRTYGPALACAPWVNRGRGRTLWPRTAMARSAPSHAYEPRQTSTLAFFSSTSSWIKYGRQLSRSE